MNNTATRVSSIDLSTLPLGSFVRVDCNLVDARIYRHWEIGVIDTRTSQRVMRSIQETSKLLAREADYIGVSLRAQDLDGGRDTPISRPVAAKRLSVGGQPWRLVFPQYHPYAIRGKATAEDAVVTDLAVWRPNAPQPTLDLADLPIGTCVEIRTTSSLIRLVVTTARHVHQGRMVFGVLYSSDNPDGYTGPPTGIYRFIEVGGRIEIAGGGASSIVLKYKIL